MTATRLLAAMVMGCAAAGCVHTGFAGTPGVVVAARSPTCHLDVVFQEPPPYRYVELGQVVTHSTTPGPFAIGENDVVTMRRLMEQACAAGAHGLMNVTVESGRVRVGKGTWRTSRGSAMAFLYVDASGRPLPPPDGPQDSRP